MASTIPCPDEIQSMEAAYQNESFLESLPRGYRFCPLDHELIVHYLKNKNRNLPLPPNRIKEVYNLEEYKACGEREGYFFTHRKFRNGNRTNRTAGDGFWKATVADRPVHNGVTLVGYKKALVFYRGKPPGIKTDWLMQEYRVVEEDDPPPAAATINGANHMRLDDFVLCRIYNHKADKGSMGPQKNEVTGPSSPPQPQPPPPARLSDEDSTEASHEQADHLPEQSLQRPDEEFSNGITYNMSSRASYILQNLISCLYPSMHFVDYLQSKGYSVSFLESDNLSIEDLFQDCEPVDLPSSPVISLPMMDASSSSMQISMDNQPSTSQPSSIDHELWDTLQLPDLDSSTEEYFQNCDPLAQSIEDWHDQLWQDLVQKQELLPEQEPLPPQSPPLAQPSLPPPLKRRRLG
ncbi:hypothetical protein HHK36_019778 [Tetracentron sinense]|uniref:NAC domain-containing protein n=1 Tax=Tetracentron sinense TaxID=13715 RepID=A0A835DD29_TETSI|nr:hypothetical protein HHK36_019778 [Tetracentron sinense]